MLIELGIVVIMRAVIFADDIGDWHDKDDDVKTWAAFQAHFISAQSPPKFRFFHLIKKLVSPVLLSSIVTLFICK